MTKHGVRRQKKEKMAGESKILVSNKCPCTCKHPVIKQKREEVEQFSSALLCHLLSFHPLKNVLSLESVVIVKKEISKVRNDLPGWLK